MPDDLTGRVIEPGSLVLPSGRPGVPGGRGDDGLPTWTPVTENFEVPEIGGDVVVEVEHTDWITIGAYVVIDQMIGEVMAVDGTAVTVRRVASPQGQIGTRGPRGEQGEDGKDGEPGEDGKDGASAFELAVDEGFEGSLPEWLESLVGPQGEQGEQGLIDEAPEPIGDPAADTYGRHDGGWVPVLPISEMSIGTNHLRIGSVLIQWGKQASSGGDNWIPFPIYFGGAPTAVIVTPESDASNIGAGNQFLSYMAEQAQFNAFFLRPRYGAFGGVGGTASQGFWWLAIGPANA